MICKEIWGNSGCLPLLFICEKYSDARLSQNASRDLVELLVIDTKTLLWGQETLCQNINSNFFPLFKTLQVCTYIYMIVPYNLMFISSKLLYVIFMNINSYNVKGITCLNNDIYNVSMLYNFINWFIYGENRVSCQNLCLNLLNMI